MSPTCFGKQKMISGGGQANPTSSHHSHLMAPHIFFFIFSYFKFWKGMFDFSERSN